MKHIKTLNTQTLNHTVKKGGCGECQTSCQSACKTSCTVGNKSDLREQKIILLHVGSAADLPAGAKGNE